MRTFQLGRSVEEENTGMIEFPGVIESPSLAFVATGLGHPSHSFRVFRVFRG